MSMQEFSDNLSTLSYVSRRRAPLWLFDPKKKTLLGRTATSWALCLLFYLVYYTCLAAFFMGMMMVFLHTQVPTGEPTRTGMQSILQLRPGLGFRPMVDVRKSLIKFAKSDPQQYLLYTENINAYLEIYDSVNSKPSGQFANCDNGTKIPDDVEKVCRFPLSKLDPCNRENKFGYPDGKPCVIVKLNKIYGWLPDIERPELSSNVLINCTGQNPADVDNIHELDYYPGVSIDGKKYGMFENTYFPFLGQPGYLAPLVAVQFKSVTSHMAILVECQLRNLKNAYESQLAFELMVD
ncbi:Sodium/potassium-transporting ATPase subunit beta [Paragonimus heterotremus]|uniref:Sodium/potassium-transporting ATPase subunit beta n=1 Tax=Paragonimus heterotremus TaxID=100268 RepID=A0A8J4TL11_9TREM|nr:Sodium/potassium-transporting ATPase subunit beta [Paragonimus heterotremus]